MKTNPWSQVTDLRLSDKWWGERNDSSLGEILGDSWRVLDTLVVVM